MEPDTIARIDALAEAFRRSSADAAALIRRLSAIAQTADAIVPGDGFHDFCLTIRASSSRSVIAWRTEAWIPIAMTCSPRKRA